MAVKLSTRARQWVLLGVGFSGLVGLALIVAWAGADPKPKAKETPKPKFALMMRRLPRNTSPRPTAAKSKPFNTIWKSFKPNSVLKPKSVRLRKK